MVDERNHNRTLRTEPERAKRSEEGKPARQNFPAERRPKTNQPNRTRPRPTLARRKGHFVRAPGGSRGWIVVDFALWPLCALFFRRRWSTRPYLFANRFGLFTFSEMCNRTSSSAIKLTSSFPFLSVSDQSGGFPYVLVSSLAGCRT